MKNVKSLEWIAGDDVGISSKNIWCVMMGCKPTWVDIPYDPADFGRCYRLLRLIPDWVPKLYLMAEKYHIWRPMIANWVELTDMYINDDKTMHKMMQVIVDECRIADG
jgi:hypothetical protein